MEIITKHCWGQFFQDILKTSRTLHQRENKHDTWLHRATFKQLHAVTDQERWINELVGHWANRTASIFIYKHDISDHSLSLSYTVLQNKNYRDAVYVAAIQAMQNTEYLHCMSVSLVITSQKQTQSQDKSIY